MAKKMREIKIFTHFSSAIKAPHINSESSKYEVILNFQIALENSIRSQLNTSLKTQRIHGQTTHCEANNIP